MIFPSGVYDLSEDMWKGTIGMKRAVRLVEEAEVILVQGNANAVPGCILTPAMGDVLLPRIAVIVGGNAVESSFCLHDSSEH